MKAYQMRTAHDKDGIHVDCKAVIKLYCCDRETAEMIKEALSEDLLTVEFIKSHYRGIIE